VINLDADADEVWRVIDRMATAWERRHREGQYDGCPTCGDDGCDDCGKCPVGKGGRKAGGDAERPLRDDEF